jgi:anti-anti-sigma factor
VCSVPETASPAVGIVGTRSPGSVEITVCGTDPRTLRLRGELDSVTSPMLRSALQGCSRTATGLVVLDLSGVEFLSASALTVLVEAHHRIRVKGGRLLLSRPTGMHRRIFAITGVDHVLVVEDL